MIGDLDYAVKHLSDFHFRIVPVRGGSDGDRGSSPPDSFPADGGDGGGGGGGSTATDQRNSNLPPAPGRKGSHEQLRTRVVATRMRLLDHSKLQHGAAPSSSGGVGSSGSRSSGGGGRRGRNRRRHGKHSRQVRFVSFVTCRRVFQWRAASLVTMSTEWLNSRVLCCVRALSAVHSLGAAERTAHLAGRHHGGRDEHRGRRVCAGAEPICANLCRVIYSGHQRDAGLCQPPWTGKQPRHIVPHDTLFCWWRFGCKCLPVFGWCAGVLLFTRCISLFVLPWILWCIVVVEKILNTVGVAG